MFEMVWSMAVRLDDPMVACLVPLTATRTVVRLDDSMAHPMAVHSEDPMENQMEE